MLLNIIHDPLRKDRFSMMMNEILTHQLFPFRIWDAVKEFPIPRQNISEAHKQIVRWAKETQQQECMIAEDDFKILGSDGYKFYLKNKPQDFDLYLASIHGGGISNNNETSSFSGFQFYTIHSKFYNTFLEADRNTDIDRAMKGKGRFLVCNPFAIIQAESFSDNTKKIHRIEKLYRNRNLYGQ